MFISKLLLFLYSIIATIASLDPPLYTLIAESKLAFIRDPNVNTAKIQKHLEVQDDVSGRWPNGIVNYYVDYRSYDANIDTEINQAIEIIEKSSCIKFSKLKAIPYENTTWIHITNPRKGRECVHEPKLIDSGEIVLPLGYDCLKLNEILHTLLHGIGIKDEVTHPHRDKYIRVLWDNIQPAYHYLYRKQPVKSSKILTEYDPLSVMQFYDRAFSKNGRATISPVIPGLLIFPSEALSQLDIMRLQVYFGRECSKRKVSTLLNSCKISLKDQRDPIDGEHFANNKTQDAVNDDIDYTAENENQENRTENVQSVEEMETLYGTTEKVSDIKINETVSREEVLGSRHWNNTYHIMVPKNMV